MTPKLAEYDWVVVNSSAGKDSAAALAVTVRTAREQGYPLSRIVVAHATFPEEWDGTKELAAEHAARYGLRFECYERPQGGLLDMVLKRGKWPSNKQRYCTSELKRGQIAKLFTKLTKETHENQQYRSDANSGDPGTAADRAAGDRADDPQSFQDGVHLAVAVRRSHQDAGPLDGRGLAENGQFGRSGPRPRRAGHALVPPAQVVRFLSVFGFRAEESPARKKKPVFARDARLTNSKRQVDVWLPIHHLPVAEVWRLHDAAGLRRHWAYARGMTRLSCRLCIFAPDAQLVLSARQPENRGMFERYVQVQVQTGHKFRLKTDLVELKKKVDDPAYTPRGGDDGCWGM